ncbi:hypothetical protein AB6N24_14305 [Cellulomonas sp. 179-A 4D5 NHS]|uniref:hypothetical protein n=1 Tax=Cellulomonas sp. 179-A 4D5 NHS TaxID=3142378 RepID=UPI0039A138E9
MGEQAMLSWNSGAQRWQRLVNEVDVPPAHEQTTAPAPVPCVARLAWEHDGPQLVETEAIGWTPAAVLVRIYDPRRQLGGVWVPVSDVRRRGTD